MKRLQTSKALPQGVFETIKMPAHHSQHINANPGVAAVIMVLNFFV